MNFVQNEGYFIIEYLTIFKKEEDSLIEENMALNAPT